MFCITIRTIFVALLKSLATLASRKLYYVDTLGEHWKDSFKLTFKSLHVEEVQVFKQATVRRYEQNRSLLTYYLPNKYRRWELSMSP